MLLDSKFINPRTRFLTLLVQLILRAASRADCTAGRRRPTSVPMMAMTTRSSTSVKPPRRTGDLRDMDLVLQKMRRIVNELIKENESNGLQRRTRPKTACGPKERPRDNTATRASEFAVSPPKNRRLNVAGDSWNLTQKSNWLKERFQNLPLPVPRTSPLGFSREGEICRLTAPPHRRGGRRLLRLKGRGGVAPA